MRVLVTGGAGFIGSNLAIELVGRGAQVTVIDSFHRLGGAREENLAPVASKIRLLRGDQGDPAILAEALDGVDTVFNLAGLTGHSDSMREPLTDLDANLRAQVVLLEACRALKAPPRVVFASTRQVYGAPVHLPVDETHPIHPPDTNAIHKHATESYHRLYAQVYGLRTLSLRLTNTYGPRMPTRDARLGVVGWFVNRALAGEEIQLFGGGEQMRDFTYVDDAVAAFLAADACLAREGGAVIAGQVFNLSGDQATLERVAALLIGLSGKGTWRRVDFPPERKVIDIGNFYCTSARFEALSGWRPQIRLDDGLRRTVEFFRPGFRPG